MLGWIGKLLGGDETRDWPDVRPVALTLDLTHRSLNGISLGDAADKLKLLGRPRLGRNGSFGYYDYPTLGAQIVASDGRIVSFGIAIGPVEPSIPPNTTGVTLVWQGRSTPISAETKLAGVVSALGFQVREDRDEEELVATVLLGDAEANLECTLDGRLQWVELSA